MSPSNRYIILGPPGTGKTTELRRIIRRCAEQYGADQILATSFSKTAALNIIAPRDGEEDLPIPSEHVGTMHALCFKALHMTKKQMTEAHLAKWEEANQRYALSETQKRATASLDEPEADAHYETLGDEVMGKYNFFRNRMVPRDQWPQYVAQFAARWEQWKSESDLMDFTDLIERCLHDPYHHIPDGCKALVVDEFQDLPPLQHALFAKWAGDALYSVAAGDDDQLIFGHTGATAESLHDDSVPSENIRVLPQSRRVPRRVQAMANAWITGVTKRAPKVYNPRDAEGVVRLSNGKYTQPDLVIADAKKQIIAGRSVMFLAACSYMVTPLTRELRAAGIAFHNPYRPSRGDWNPLSTRGRSMAERLHTLVSYDAAPWTWRDLDAVVSVLRADGVTVRGAKEEIDGRADDKMMAWQEVDPAVMKGLLQPEAFYELIMGNVEWWTARLLPKSIDPVKYPLAILNTFGASALTATPRAVVGTIHSVKGAEADTVYVFPDISRNAARAMSNGPAGRDAVIRQFYVAMTRARESLVICCPATKYFADLPVKAGMRKMEIAA